MRQKSLVIYAALLTLLPQSKVFCQCQDPKPYPCITEDLAKERVSFFSFKKRLFHDKLWEVSDLELDRSNLSALTNFLASLRAGTYDGIRVYFALSDEMATTPFKPNNLYIVLVATKPNSVEPDGEPMSDDDVNTAVIISDKNIMPVNLNTDYVQKWINRYLNKAAPRIEAKLDKHGYKIHETRSLWYSARAMFRNDPRDGFGSDLLTYLSSHPVTVAKIEFATWALDPSLPDPEPFPLQTSLIFKFDDVLLTFEATDLINAIRKNKALNPSEKRDLEARVASTYTDTGNPCAPSKCP